LTGIEIKPACRHPRAPQRRLVRLRARYLASRQTIGEPGTAARPWSASGLPFSARSRGADDAEPCCPALRSGNSYSSTSTDAGCHTWCKRTGFVRVVAGDK
jgi:hypothetical protein